MESLLSVQETITPKREPLILDGDAEILYKKIICNQKDAIFQNLLKKQSDYESVFWYSFNTLSDDDFSMNAAAIRSQSQRELLERLVSRAAKKRIVRDIILFFSSAIGMIVLLGRKGVIWFLFLWFVSWVISILYTEDFEKSMRWLTRFRFFWSKFMLRRISKKIEKLQSGDA